MSLSIPRLRRSRAGLTAHGRGRDRRLLRAVADRLEPASGRGGLVVGEVHRALDLVSKPVEPPPPLLVLRARAREVAAEGVVLVCVALEVPLKPPTEVDYSG